MCRIRYASVCFFTHEGAAAKECTVSWTGAAGTRSGMGFIAETGSGHVVPMDGAPDEKNPANGGQNLAARPMELLLAGAGPRRPWSVVRTRRNGCPAASHGSTA